VSDPTGWMDSAVCAQTFPDIFFPSSGDGGYEMKREALAVCGVCPVKAECLQYALNNALDYGIYGGLTAQERKALGRPKKRRSDLVLFPCGTYAAYVRHLRAGERPCEPCRQASRVRSASKKRGAA